MILPVHSAVRLALAVALERIGVPSAEHPTIVIETPPRRDLGDLAIPVAFELARRLRKAPKAIAQELATALDPIAAVARVEAANGYLNLFLDRALLARQWNAESSRPGGSTAGKVIVEHTAINPNKAAHIGHLRNSTLGDTLVRLLRFQGREVEVQNYIDDTGVQVADVVVGFTTLEQRDLDGVRALADDPSVRFDYYCWDLYAKVTSWYDGDKAHLETRSHTLHAIEEGRNPIAEMGAFIADRIVRCHLKTMARLNVDYDLLTWEGDILRLHFWAKAFDELKSRGAVVLRTDGRLAGCWVMPIGDAAPGSTDDPTSDDDPEAREKVIVRSNGTVTYVGKDIANQFWKFGLLGKDFSYRTFATRPNGQPLWATTSAPTEGHPPSFGRAAAVYNVIDSRQSYLQELLKQSLQTMGFGEQAHASTHFSYEMVALSHATAKALGYQAAPDGRPFVEVSGRKGLGVKADDLIDTLTATARVEVMKRNAELSDADSHRIAESIAIAAVRYFLVKFTRGKVIAFDIDEALSFEGESGPYLQYAVVRANNILVKLAERDGIADVDLAARVAALDRSSIDAGEDGDELWSLMLDAARLDEIVDTSVRSLELSVLAKYTFGLSQAFNAFYHRQPILKEERDDARLWRALGVKYLRDQMTRALDLMGCSVPSRM